MIYVTGITIVTLLTSVRKLLLSEFLTSASRELNPTTNK